MKVDFKKFTWAMASFVMTGGLFLSQTRAWAEESAIAAPDAGARSLSPYIDQIRQDFPAVDPGEKSYTEKLKQDIGEPENGSAEGYTESLRAKDPALNPQNSEPSYLELERQKLTPKAEGGAIDAVTAGTSELKPRFEGDIHHAFGLRYGAKMTRDITAPSAAADFSSIYGGNYALDLGLFYEWQPFHSEIFGNIGLVGSFGVGYFHGQGTFAVTLAKPWAGGGNFPAQSLTSFQFFEMPLMVGADYRFNLTHYIRPFVMAGPVVVGYFEQRNDGAGDTYQGDSRGMFFSAGANLLLDWINSGSTWDSYMNSGIRHTYLTLEYSRISTFSGEVAFGVSGIQAGLTFEY